MQTTLVRFFGTRPGEFTAAAAIATGTHVAIRTTRILPRMTARWTIVLVIGIGIATTLVAAKVHLSRVAVEYRAIAEGHSSQFSALIIGKKWSGSFIDINGDDHFIDFNGGSTGNEEELKGRDLAIVLWHSELADEYQSRRSAPGYTCRRTLQSPTEAGHALAPA